MGLAIFLRRAFYIRFPLMCGLFLVSLGPIACWTDARQLLANTLLLHTWWQTASLTAICLIAATLFFVQASVILFNGSARFRDLETAPRTPLPGRGTAAGSSSSVSDAKKAAEETPTRRLRWEWSFGKAALCLVVGLSLPLTAVVHSIASRAEAAELGEFDNTIDLLNGSGGLVFGVLAYLAMLLAVVLIQSWFIDLSVTIPHLLPIAIESSKPTSEALWSFDHWLAQFFPGAGYTDLAEKGDESTRYFCPGHWQQGMLLAAVLIVYLLLGYLTVGTYASPTPIPLSLPTSFFVILLLLFVSAVLAGASFLLDYYRFPVVLILAAGLWLSFRNSNRDYFFDVTDWKGDRHAPEWLPSFAPGDRRLPLDKTGKQRTLVVVTAPGGGIHAAAWTAQVLTGLHCRYGDDYAKSLGLISAVSGGSVGAMYYAANFDALVEPPPGDSAAEEARRMNGRSIVERAAGSGLEAVGWGMLYHDLPGLLPFINPAGDRGKTLEECWQSRLLLAAAGDPAAVTLAGWRERVQQGRMPVVVFNATEVESGRRVLFSPVVAGVRHSFIRPGGSGAGHSDAAPVEFSAPFGHKDLHVVTAARLSATFPYVSPTATAKDLEELGHLADGGYIDNEGILTAVDWLSRLSGTFDGWNPETRQFDRVLLLRIRHEAPHDPLALESGETSKKDRERDGFTFAVFGPLKAVLTVRGTSQVERGQVEVDLASDCGTGLEIKSVFLDCKLGNRNTAPLSWKLAPDEFVRYEEAWRDLEKSDAIRTIDTYFTSKPPPP